MKTLSTLDLYDEWVYENTPDNSSRFLLGQPGDNPLVCFGINTSTAEPNNLDNTLTRVRNESIAKGFSGWYMFNVYPQRATNPNDLHKECDVNLHKQNIKCIKKFFKKQSNLTIWAAWGTLITKRPYLIDCLKDIINAIGDNHRWVKMGALVGKIHPHHPLYLKKGLEFEQFNLSVY